MSDPCRPRWKTGDLVKVPALLTGLPKKGPDGKFLFRQWDDIPGVILKISMYTSVNGLPQYEVMTSKGIKHFLESSLKSV